MAVSHHMHTALLTEHFRYTPLTLLDDIINTVNEIVFRAVNALEQGLGEIPADALGFKLTREQHDATKSQSEAAREQLLSEMKQTEIEQGIVKLESLLNSTVDKDFDKFEIYTLRNILAVGHQEEDLVPWVRLKHYQGLDFDEVVRTNTNGQGQHTELPSPEELQVRRRKLQETKKLNAMLKAEEARNAVVLEQLRALRTKSTSLTGDGQDRPAPLACLVAAASSTSKSGRSLTQDTQYAMKQLPVLRELLGRLKDSLDTLPNARYADEDEDSAAASRRRYLDSQSLRAVERRRVDAEMGPAMTLAGRRIDKSEVEGVKAVLEAFQRGNVQDEKPEDEEMEGE